jgi:hypothetical protein
MKSQVGITGWIIGNAEYSKCQPTDIQQRICKRNDEIGFFKVEYCQWRYPNLWNTNF